MEDVVFQVATPEGSHHGILAFAIERRRQCVEKGFTPEHDKDHPAEELVAAGKCYIDWALWDMTGTLGDSPPFDWPWNDSDWKPEGSPLENLRKGGALVAAGYDRIMTDLELDL